MEKRKSVSIIIPVYNEEIELSDSVKTVVSFAKTHLADFRWEVVIADNASTDRTLSIAKKLAKEHTNVRVCHLDQKGRGRAVGKAWAESTSDYCAYLDVDLSTDLRHLPPLIRSLQRGYDVAIGTRNAWGSRVYGRSLLRTITSKGYIALIKMFFLVRFSDAQCGFKAVSRKIIENVLPLVKDTGWFFDTEFLLIAEKSGYRVYEEPVTWTDNPGSTVRVMKTAQGDLLGLKRLFFSRPWMKLRSRKE